MSEQKRNPDEMVLHREESGEHDGPPSEKSLGANETATRGSRREWSENLRVWLQTTSAIATVVVAVTALVVALNAEQRSSARFQQQLDQADRTAKADLRPLLTIYTLVYLNKKGIVLANQGIGPAIITSVRISRGNKTVDLLPELFDLSKLFNRAVAWDDFTDIGAETYVKSGEEVNLILLSTGNLGNQGFSARQQGTIMEEFANQTQGVSIRIEYEDILENKQEPHEETW